MLYEFKSWQTDSVCASVEIDDYGVRLGAAVKAAAAVKIKLSEADLGYAPLTGAELRYAYLRGADLSGADLSDAKTPGARVHHKIHRPL